MATVRLIPSTIYNAASGYLTISNADNAYTNTDSTNYATVQNTTASTSSRYIYIRGFNFSSIPSNAVVSSFTVKLKAYQSGGSTNTSYRPYLCNNTTTITGNCGIITTSAQTLTFTGITVDWDTIKGYGTNGADFGIRINCRRNSRNTAAYFYIYGAEIEVTYTAETVHPTSVSVSPSTASIETGETVQLTETVLPSNATDKSVTWSSNNTSVATVSNSGLVTGVSAGSATITVTTVDGSKTATCAVMVTPAVMYEYALATSMEVGKSYLIANGNSGTVYLLSNESGGSRLLKGISTTVSNGKISINGATKAKAEFECIRYTSGNDVTITVSSDNKYLYTDNSTGLRMNSPTTLDRFWHYKSDTHKFWQFKNTTTDGYTDTSSEYKYYLTLSSGNFTDNHVTSPSIADTNIPAMYIYEPYIPTTNKLDIKKNGVWIQATKAYNKINGSWVEQSDLTIVFQAGINYVCGD